MNITENTVTHYGIIGLGPIGLTIATHLGKAMQKVSALCIDQAKMDSLKDQPLRVTGALSAECGPIDLFVDMGRFIAARPDIVVIASKSCDSPGILRQINESSPHDKMIFVSCQNGIDVEEQIVEVFGPARALRMVMNLGCAQTSASEVKVNFAFTQYLSAIGTVDSAITRKLAHDLSSAGLVVELRTDYRTDIFKKAILNSSIGTICALTGVTMSAALEDPCLRELIESIVRESIAVARAMDLPISEEYLPQAMEYLSHGGNHRPSLLMDIDAGRMTENESHCGRIIHYAKKHGVSAPVTLTAYLMMKSLEKRRSST